MSLRCGKWLVCLMFIIALAGTALHAQESPVLSAAARSSSEPLISSSRNMVRVPPVAPGQRVADKPFWTLVAVTAGSAVLDGETTMRGLATGRYREVNPVLGSHPGRARFYLTVGATDAALSYVAWRLKRGGHEKLWKVPLLGATTVHLGGAFNNLQY